MSELAARYAGALGALGCREADLREARELLTGDAALWAALTSPAISPCEKGAVLSRLPLPRENPFLLPFCRLLCDKGRMGLLGEITQEFHKQVLRKENRAVCVLTCVRTPGADLLAALEGRLCSLHHRGGIEWVVRTDPALLGGFTLEIEGVTYDKSVRGQLRTLARRLQRVGSADSLERGD